MISSDVELLSPSGSRGYSPELYIWTWYASGFEGARKYSRWVNWQAVFSECFEKEANGKCGWKPDKKIAKELKRNRTDRWNKNPLKKLFTDRPPPEAVEFAMRSLGTCFGDDPSLPELYELGLVEDAFDMNACKDLASHLGSLKYNPGSVSPELAKHPSWGIALNNYMTRPGETEPVKACRVVPEAGLPIIESYQERMGLARQAQVHRALRG